MAGLKSDMVSDSDEEKYLIYLFAVALEVSPPIFSSQEKGTDLLAAVL